MGRESSFFFHGRFFYNVNVLVLLNNNLNVRLSKLKENGEISFEDLKRKIDKHTVLVAVCHIASQCGNILDVEKLNKNKFLFDNVGHN